MPNPAPTGSPPPLSTLLPTALSNTLPLIVGLAGTSISDDEKKFFRNHPPFGFILFGRNIETSAQVISLTRELRAITNNEKIWIFVDQEGGRVARLKPPLVKPAPPMAAFVDLYHRNYDDGLRAVELYAQLQSAELVGLGINANCVPVLDIRFSGAHDIIGDRAFGDNGDDIIALAGHYTAAVMAAGIMPVMKHIPGHGRALADSHHELPVVTTDLAELQRTDFLPFRHFAKTIPLAMTAHVLYAAIDDKPATLSKKIIDEVIRGWMGFDGLLMTDDLSMQALSGDMVARGRESLLAGCDILLHCNGKMDEMTALVAAIDAAWDDKKQARFKKSCQNLANLATAWQREKNIAEARQENLSNENIYQAMKTLLAPHWQA